jgi:hypothetical protein
MGTETEFSVANRAVRNIALSGDHLFVTDSWHTLFIYNVSIPANPLLVGHFQAAVPKRMVDVKLSGSTAYLVGDFSGLRVIDVSQPADMQELAFDDQRIDLNLQTPSALHLTGDYALISDNNTGFRTYDIRDPANPVLSATILDIGFVNDMVVSGNYAYLASVVWKEDDAPRLYVVDSTNPSSPQLINQTDIPLKNEHSSWVMAGAGEWLYLLNIASTGSPGQVIYVYSLADPAQPAFSGQFTLPAPLMGGGSLLLDGSTMYAGSLAPPLMVLDLTNPLQPTPTAMSTFFSAGYNLQTGGGRLYSANSFGLMGYDLEKLVSDPMQAMTAMAMLPSHTFAIAVAGDRLYAAGLDFGLYVFNIE